MRKVLLALLYGTLLLPAAASAAPRPTFQPPGPNIARGRPYVLSPEPNYAHCSKDPERTLLTDGRTTQGFFWMQPTTVGWEGKSFIEITIDLGQVEPIAGASFSTAGGGADVNWPRALLLFVSEDNRRFFAAGDLVMDSALFGMPAPEGYQTHRYVSDRLRTKGRYVKLLVDAVPNYVFCDEVDVYRGSDALLSQPAGEAVADLKAYAVRHRLDACIARRLFADLLLAGAAVEDSPLPAERKAAARADLEQLRGEIERLSPAVPEGFRAVLPLNDLDRRLFAWRGAALKARGWPELVLWRRGRWDPLGPADAPEALPAAPPALKIDAMLGERRSDAFNLTNASEQPLRVRLSIEGMPGGTALKYLTLHHVPIVAVSSGETTADALPELKPDKEGCILEIPAGMNTQVWVQARPRDLRAGTYAGRIVVRPERGAPAAVPITLRVWPMRFPDRPRLSLSGCEYSDPGLGRGITERNVDPLLHFLQDRFVDSPWAQARALALPGAGDFDAGDRLVRKPDFASLDAWLARWPKARNYFVYVAADPGAGFAGAAMGSPEFERRLEAYIGAFVKHVRARGKKPEQFYLLVVDEPTQAAQCETISAWARAIRRAPERPRVWVSFFASPTPEFFGRMFLDCDMLCAHVPGLVAWDGKGREAALGKAGPERSLWLYSAIGPSRTFDPYTYYRLLPWLCYRHGARGCLFWAFGDVGGAPSSWDDFLAAGHQYCPQYIEPDGMTDSKQMQAIVEGMEDHETLSLLADRVRALGQSGRHEALLTRARQLLERAPAEVTANLSVAQFRWSTAKDRAPADRVRLEALEMLEGFGE